MLLAGAGLGAVEAVNPDVPVRVVWQFGLGLLVLAVVVGRGGGVWRFADVRWVLAVSFSLCVALSFGVVAVWPNSGDEYGYVYIADTLLRGRVWNPPSPSAELFRFNWIFEQAGRRFSQYPPGWSVFLVPFRWAGVPQLANPVLTLGLGFALVAGLRRLAVAPPAVAALAALSLLSPFTLFNGASYFAHTASAACVMAICWLQLRDEATPGAANRLAIGAMFAILLSVRYEVFAILAALYAADRLWHRRLAAVRDAGLMLLGAAPFLVAMLAYNAAITSQPFTTPFGWANPQLGLGLHAIGNEGAPPPFNALKHGVRWLGELAQFGGLLMVVAYGAALVTKYRCRSLRFFDLIPIGCVAFFAFYPDFGGHQYGPRYWFFAWSPMALTVGGALVDGDARLRLFRWRPHLPGVAALQLASFAATTLMLAWFLHDYIGARRAVYAATPPAPRALILYPTRWLVLGPWQAMPYREVHTDLTRNDTDFDAPILYGRGGDAHLEALACGVADRPVYAWEEPGRLHAITCP
jgi:hypothetical protein